MATQDSDSADAPTCSTSAPSRGFDVGATQLTRRSLIGAAAGVALAGCAGNTNSWTTTKVPTGADNVVEIDIKDFPELATPGGMVALDPEGAKKPVLVMRVENDQFRVMSLRCPHLGCTVRWDTEMQELACPCHGSRFRDTGQRIKGPAGSDLVQMRSQFIGMKGTAGGTKLRFVLRKT